MIVSVKDLETVGVAAAGTGLQFTRVDVSEIVCMPESAKSLDENEKFICVAVTDAVKEAADLNGGKTLKSNYRSYPQAGVQVVSPDIAKEGQAGQVSKESATM